MHPLIHALIEGRNDILKNAITLYHGSVYEFDTVDVTKGKPFKDFGIGFYTTQNIDHAKRLAIRNKNLEEKRKALRGNTEPSPAWLYTYEFDIAEINKLNTRKFDTADREWVQFVIQNRRSQQKEHDYDIVIGPTANDNTNATIDLFMMGTYGDPQSNFAIETFLRLILPEVLPQQIYFGSMNAANHLLFKGRESI